MISDKNEVTEQFRESETGTVKNELSVSGELPQPAAHCPENILTPSVSVTFTPSRRKTTRRIRIAIEGEFTVQHITMISERVHQVFQNFEYADYVLQNIRAIDLSAVQLMHRLKSFCRGTGKFITIDAQLESDASAMLVSAGLNEILTTPKNG